MSNQSKDDSSISLKNARSGSVRSRNRFPAKILVASAFVVVQVTVLLWFHALLLRRGDDFHHANKHDDAPKTNRSVRENKEVFKARIEAPPDEPVLADGYFNNFPLKKMRVANNLESSFYSSVHCAGDNFDKENSWISKTCHFRNLCFDTKSHDFVLISSRKQDQLEELLKNTSLTYTSVSTAMKHDYNDGSTKTTKDTGSGIKTSIGGINPKWGNKVDSMKWFPVVKSYDESFSEELRSRGVYVLPSDVLMFPYHSFAGFNPGHLLWDDFLPMHTLLHSFGLLDFRLMFLRYVMPNNEPPLWASCDRQRDKCYAMMEKFMPLMGVNVTENYSSMHEFELRLPSRSRNDANATTMDRRPYVCASHGVAGMGMATDHGDKLHGWAASDFEHSHNKNRGASMYDFRNFMLDNIEVSTEPLRSSSTKKCKIVFSVNSSSNGNRITAFGQHVQALENGLDRKYYDTVEIRKQRMSDLSIKEQATLLSDTCVFVTVCGGGSVSGVFLPRGASILIFFHEEDGVRKTPARLDWDFFNHATWLRTHWLPRPKLAPVMGGSPHGPTALDLNVFVRLVEQELDIISNL